MTNLNKLVTSLELSKRLKELCLIWCDANAKVISLDVFKEKTGYGFNEFFIANKRLCLSEWRKRQEIKKKKPVTNCNCERMSKIENSYRVSDHSPRALWHCPKHGNRFDEILTSNLINVTK